MISMVRKRNGEAVEFDINKVIGAVKAALDETKEVGPVEKAPVDPAVFIARKVQSTLARTERAVGVGLYIPSVETVQDQVERELMLEGYTATARAYIIYREAHAKLRAQNIPLDPKVQALVGQSQEYFRNPLAEFVYFRSYSRWLADQQRRETWVETVDRYVTYMHKRLDARGCALKTEEYLTLRKAILQMEAMPSMRLIWSAGVACDSSDVCAYNCAFIAPSSFQDFAEVLYVLTCGTGMGFSVENSVVQQLPIVKRQRSGAVERYVIADSKEGWGDALTLGLQHWYEGSDIEFDYSQIRPMGARLKTMGGMASGPQPLRELLTFSRGLIMRRQGRRLSSVDVHDILCKIGDCVVAGGVRRSAMLSLSDLDDAEMRAAKAGHFFISNGHRALANNSAIYPSRPTDEQFLGEWLSLVQSRSGERGIFNRGDLLKQIPERRVQRWKDLGIVDEEGNFVQSAPPIGTNPCGEIVLQHKQFCNLSEVVCRDDDDLRSLIRKTELATVLGSYQATLTNFSYLSDDWKRNCDAERLLGVSLTGQWDCGPVRNPAVLKALRARALTINQMFAKRFGIAESSAVTCVKPSGTLSQLVDAASGMHTRYATHYVRRIRVAATDPLLKMLRDQGVPCFPEVGQREDNANTFVLEFPVKTSGVSLTLTAEEQLQHWLMVKENFTEHNPSVTITIGDEEWVWVGAWIMKHWEKLGGLAFLPRDEHVYQLAPFEKIDESEYLHRLAKFSTINYAEILRYERDDETSGARELACVGNACEV